jgi:hypothetical protein
MNCLIKIGTSILTALLAVTVMVDIVTRKNSDMDFLMLLVSGVWMRLENKK